MYFLVLLFPRTLDFLEEELLFVNVVVVELSDSEPPRPPPLLKTVVGRGIG